MNQIKRQLSFSQTSNEPIKKLRIFLERTCLEDLSNELFYEIFDYLDGYDIHKAFLNLNIRFQNLLTNSLLPLKINLSSKSKSTVEDRCRYVIIPNKHRILSLHLENDLLINEFFVHCNIDPSFNRLESVALNGLSAYKLTTILFYLNYLPRLSSLIIQLEEDYYCNLSDIYRLIFRLQHLKYNKLSITDHEEPDIFIPMSINEQPSTIERLVIEFSCTVNELTSLLLHTPHLQQLTCERLVETDEIDRKEERLTLPHLTYISIADCDIDFDKTEPLIKKMSSQLKVLRLKTSSFISYLDANRWKQLIKKHMPHLCEFHLDCHAYADYFADMTPQHEAMNQFTSSFWTERQWFFEFNDSPVEVVYSIHPYRKKWFDYHKYEQTINRLDRITDQYAPNFVDISCRQQSDKATISPIQLTIEGYTSNSWDPSYIDDMKSCFVAVQFTHLNIDCNGLLIGMLVEIIRLLPNLDSLEVSSLSLTPLNGLSFDDSEMLLLVSITNKITKVKLNKMNGLEQIHFLMNLCPRMEYLEVGCPTENDLENIIGCISMNNTTRILYLCCLCLCVLNANEKMIQHLDQIISFERLFHIDNKTFCDYVIQRRQDKIFLNWKLP